jgi:hypothetical protein
MVRDWLLQRVSHRSRLLRRLTLADATPAVQEALELLARQYGNEGAVPPVLELALGTRDGRAVAVRAGMRRAMTGDIPRPSETTNAGAGA